MIWLLVVTLFVAIFISLSYAWSPQAAIGIIVPIAFSVPAWIVLPLFDTPNQTVVASGVDVKVAATSICLLLFCFLPGRKLLLRLVFTDFAMLLLVACHLLSDWLNSGQALMPIGRAVAEWYLPYVAGRLAFQEPDCLAIVAKTLCVLAALAMLVGVWESVTGTNLWEIAAGRRPLEGTSRAVRRWGLYRSFGNCLHPIYFGTLQLFYFWGPVYFVVRFFRTRALALWAGAGVFCASGIGATCSRGPLLGLIVASVLAIVLPMRNGLLLATALATLMVAVGLFQLDKVVEVLETLSGENSSAAVLEIDGEEQAYSSTRHRLLVLNVYKTALRRSGLLGFGTNAVSGFPVNIPLGPQDSALFRKMRSIENSYVLLTLRFGLAGLLSFGLVLLLASTQLAITARSTSPDVAAAALASIAVLAGTATVLLTVWMPHEIGFPFIWLIGGSSGLMFTARQIESKLQEGQNEGVVAR